MLYVLQFYTINRVKEIEDTTSAQITCFEKQLECESDDLYCKTIRYYSQYKRKSSKECLLFEKQKGIL